MDGYTYQHIFNQKSFYVTSHPQPPQLRKLFYFSIIPLFFHTKQTHHTLYANYSSLRKKLTFSYSPLSEQNPNKNRELQLKNNIPGTRFMPLYFVRSGNIALNTGAMRSFGFDGNGWFRSATTYSSPTSASAYFLVFDPSGVYPSNYYNRWSVFPVRCLV